MFGLNQKLNFSSKRNKNSTNTISFYDSFIKYSNFHKSNLIQSDNKSIVNGQRKEIEKINIADKKSLEDRAMVIDKRNRMKIKPEIEKQMKQYKEIKKNYRGPMRKNITFNHRFFNFLSTKKGKSVLDRVIVSSFFPIFTFSSLYVFFGAWWKTHSLSTNRKYLELQNLLMTSMSVFSIGLMFSVFMKTIIKKYDPKAKLGYFQPTLKIFAFVPAAVLTTYVLKNNTSFVYTDFLSIAG